MFQNHLSCWLFVSEMSVSNLSIPIEGQKVKVAKKVKVLKKGKYKTNVNNNNKSVFTLQSFAVICRQMRVHQQCSVINHFYKGGSHS